MGRLGSDRIAWALFAAALGWRALHLLELSGLPDWDQVRGDEHYYLEAARALRNGTLEGPFHMSPLYIAGLAALQALFGESPWVWRLAQTALGLGSALLLHDIARRLLGLGAARWTLGLALFCAPLVFYETNLAVATLASSLVVAALWCCVCSSQARTAGRRLAANRWWAGGAVCVGLAIAARPNAALLLIGLCAWPWWALRDEPLRLRGALSAVFAVLAFAVTVPVTLFNARFEGEVVWIVDSGGLNFFIGNHRESTGSQNQPPDLASGGDVLAQDIVFRAAAERTVGKSLSRAATSRYWLNRGLQEIAADPVRWLGLVATKLRLVFGADEIANNRSLAFRAELMATLGPWLVQVGVLMPFAFLGFAVWTREPRRFDLPALFTASFVAALLLMFVVGRYRQVLLPLFILAAVTGGQWLWQRIRADDRSRIVAGLAVCSVGALVAWTGPLEAPLADDAYKHAYSLHERGDLGAAAHWYQRALEEVPGHASALNNLAILYENAGRLDEAGSLWRELYARSDASDDARHLATARRGLARLATR